MVQAEQDAVVDAPCYLVVSDEAMGVGETPFVKAMAHELGLDLITVSLP